MAKTNDIRLGQFLVQKKWCALRQVNEALLKQRRLRAQNQNLPLGRILVDAGVIDDEMLREALADLGVLQLHCALCRADYPIATYQRNSVHLCPRCKGALVLSDRPASETYPSPEIEKSKSKELGTASKPVDASTAHAADKVEAQPKSEAAPQRDAYIGKIGRAHV